MKTQIFGVEVEGTPEEVVAAIMIASDNADFLAQAKEIIEESRASASGLTHHKARNAPFVPSNKGMHYHQRDYSALAKEYLKQRDSRPKLSMSTFLHDHSRPGGKVRILKRHVVALVRARKLAAKKNLPKPRRKRQYIKWEALSANYLTIQPAPNPREFLETALGYPPNSKQHKKFAELIKSGAKQ